MPIYYSPHKSIECEQANLFFRKIIPKFPPQKHSIGTLYRFKLEINGKAHIYKKLNPKKTIIHVNSHLNKDDGVKSNVLLILTTKALKKTDHVVKKILQVIKLSFFYTNILHVLKLKNNILRYHKKYGITFLKFS